MKHLLIALLFSSFLMISCGSDTESPGENPGEKTWEERYVKADEKAEAVDSKLVMGNSKFAWKMFNALHEADEKNAFISPFSISTALTMLLNGASGENFDEIKDVLEFNDLTIEELNKNYQNLLESMNFADKDLTLSVANSLWIAENYKDAIQTDFISTLETYFATGIFPITTADEINSWIEEKTNGKIKDMLDEIPADIVLYLINAIYFKADWTYQFDPEKTEKETFFVSGNETVEVDMMKMTESTEDFKAYDDGQGTVGIRFPYGRDQFAMYVFLPDTRINTPITIDDIIEKLDADSFAKMFDNFYEQEVATISFPKFKVEYKKLLNDELKALGMKKAFLPDGLFNMVHEGSANPYVSRVIHQSFIEVNEAGTEAAAATIVEVLDESASMELHINADRPFLYVIRDDRNGSILFMGKMDNPSK